MCLLINHPANTSFDYDDIADFFSYNSDGIGVMYAEGGVLLIKKELPRDENDAWDFYTEHCIGRECVIHFRMRTHGHTDLTNCHPYEVYGSGSEMPIYMAHNGILSTGNEADVSKSDTWHYIRDFIIPLTKSEPELVFDPAFIDIIESHIGSSNKFIFMNHEGRISITNKSAFVTYKGAMLSNTYAWTAENGGYGYKNTWRSAWPPSKTEGKHGTTYDARGWDNFDDAFDDADTAPVGRSAVSYLPDAHDSDDMTFADMFFEVLDDMGCRGTYKALDWDDAITLYNTMGDEEAFAFLEEIEQGQFNDSQIQSFVTGMLLRASVNF